MCRRPCLDPNRELTKQVIESQNWVSIELAHILLNLREQNMEVHNTPHNSIMMTLINSFET